MRGDRLIIPKTLRVGVLEAAHHGHPGQQSMTRQMRGTCWWLGMNADIKEYVETCIPCIAVVERNRTEPMQIRKTLERP